MPVKGFEKALLFTDIEGSTILLQHLGDDYAAVLTRHNEILRNAIRSVGGQEVSTKGDSFFALFDTVTDAVHAAIDAQHTLQNEHWAENVSLRVRMGIHLGEVREVAGDFVGLDVHRAARIADAARGGQIILSRTAANSVEAVDLPSGATLRDIGRHNLRDLRYPESLYDLAIPDLLSDFAPIRSLGNRRTNLVPRATPLFGREDDLIVVGKLLQDRSRRVVTLVGPGGIGKSSLAHVAGEEALDNFPDGVHMVQLGSINDPELVFPSIAQTIGVRDFAARPVLMDIASDIGAERRLLILDTFEHLIEIGAQLTQLIETCPNLHVLVTSRAALNLGSEVVYAVPPLPLPDARAKLETVAATPAVRLFVDRVQEFDANFLLTAQNAPTVAKICAKLEGMPLAIELGAARMHILSADRLLDRLTARLSVLKGGRRDASTRHRTLRAAIEWSDNLLETGDREVFQRLSVFSGGFALEDAEAILEGTLDDDIDVMDAVESLVGNSLVKRGSENGEPRFGMYDMIREYAWEQLKESELMPELRNRHMSHFAELAENIGEEGLLSGMRPFLLQYLSEAGNIRNALNWALDSRDIATVARFVYALHWIWISQSNFTEAFSWADKASTLASEFADSPEAALIHEAACSIRMTGGDYIAALPHGKEALRIFTELGDKDGIARINLTHSICSVIAGELEDPSPILIETVEYFRGQDDNLASLGLILLGEGARFAEEYEAAEACYTDALEILQGLDNVYWPGHLKQNIAHFRMKEGRWQDAAVYFREAFDLAEDYGFVLVSALSVAGLSGVAQKSGDARLAAVIQGGVEAHRQKIGVDFEPTDKADIQSYIDATQQELGDAAYKAAASEGAGMDWEALCELARDVAEPHAKAA